MKTYKLLILILSFYSCQSESDKIFWINENTEHRSDFLYMAESTNLLPIQADSMKFFLYESEINETRYIKPIVFKDFGEIYKTERFKLHIIFRSGNDTVGRDYKFMLRTYSKDWEIIDSYDLAIWNKRADKYCFGSINNKLIIEKQCVTSEKPEVMQITEKGKIVMTSFHK